ncbi:hypothetical protein UVI_02019220 [Ustilaginoidea virens]|nr:hypothetical protein UVI_02019220 [Ustilaginoidea virens]
MADLDSTAQKLLVKDPSNPNSPKKAEEPARPGLGLSRSTMASSKPSLREAMMAQKKATMAAAKDLPARPGSAMAHISSPVRTTSSSSMHSTASAKSAATMRTRPESTLSVNAGGMSVAPMRPTRRRPEMAARPATAGPYSAREDAGLEAGSPESIKSRHATPNKPKVTTPKKTVPRTRPAGHMHQSHVGEPSIPSPTFRHPTSKGVVVSPRGSPSTSKYSQTSPPSVSLLKLSEEAKAPPHLPAHPCVSSNHELEGAAPSLEQQQPQQQPAETRRATPSAAANSQEEELEPQAGTLSRELKVYEDPFTDEAPLAATPTLGVSVLEDKPVNEGAGSLANGNDVLSAADQRAESPDKTGQNSKLIDSGITKIKNKNLEVHGFRKLQSLIRDSRTALADDKFEALFLGLFRYLEDGLPGMTAEKVQDVKAQILSTIKLLLKRERDMVQPHISKGMESLLQARGAYDTRAHIVSGLELLADELVTIGDGSELVAVLTTRLQSCSDGTAEGCRTLSMGLHVLKEMLEKRAEFAPTEGEVTRLTALAARCLESADSGVRMDAVKFCVSLHDRVGDAGFWESLKDIREDPKSLITYYIVKKRREQGGGC